MKTQPTVRRFAALTTGLALFAYSLTPALHAQTAAKSADPLPRFAIAGHVGTYGFGPAIVVTATRHFTATAGYTMLSYDYDIEEDRYDYKGKLKFSNLALLANWHPMGGAFHISAGGVVCNNKVDVNVIPKPGVGIEINGNWYTQSQVTSVDGTVELTKGFKPYVGLGWKKTPDRSGIGFFCDIGFILNSGPSSKLNAYGPQAGSAAVQRDLRADEDELDGDLEFFKFYPSIQLGIMYRF